MSLLSIRLLPEPVRSLNFAAIGGTYMGIGTAISNPTRIFFIQNLTNALLMFSFDGINDHFPLPSSGFLLIDVTANKALGGGFFVAEGQRLYVKEIGTPTVGDVYLTVFYGTDSGH